MPEMKIQYRQGNLTGDDVRELVLFLQEEGVKRFSLPQRPLKIRSFSVYDCPFDRSSATRQSHTLIIRIYLHPDKDRVDKAQANANELQEELYAMLNVGEMKDRYGERTVGVSISLTQIAWAGGEGND